MKTIEKLLLFSNDIDVVYGSYSELRQAYEEHSKDMDEEPEENGELEWFYNELDSYLDCAFTEIKSINKKHNQFLLVGTCGTWNGRRKGGKISGDLENLVIKAISGKDDVTIHLIDGAINIEASHHDGTNDWTIYALNRRAERTIDAWSWDLQDEELHDKLNKKYYWEKIKI